MRPRLEPINCYRRVSGGEVLQFWRQRERGWSLRKMARHARRDHHSVARWLKAEKAAEKFLKPSPDLLARAAWFAQQVPEGPERDALLARIAECYDLHAAGLELIRARQTAAVEMMRGLE
jgi:hypothetical protein